MTPQDFTATDLRTLLDRLKAAEGELETERMRLAACGVVALANTPESAAAAREMLPEYRSASLDDVERAVDEQMRLRSEIERLRQALESICEYWNGDSNETATLDAIHHAVETALAALENTDAR